MSEDARRPQLKSACAVQALSYLLLFFVPSWFGFDSSC